MLLSNLFSSFEQHHLYMVPYACTFSSDHSLFFLSWCTAQTKKEHSLFSLNYQLHEHTPVRSFRCLFTQASVRPGSKRLCCCMYSYLEQRSSNAFQAQIIGIGYIVRLCIVKLAPFFSYCREDLNIEEDKDEILSWNLNGVLKYMLGVFPFTQNIVTWENKAATTVV